MLNIVLLEPEIPQNTGNIARTCAVTNSFLHLIHPLGFKIDDKQLKRSGMDYWFDLNIFHYQNIEDFYSKNKGTFFYATTKAKKNYCELDFCCDDNIFIIFGKESAGIPEEILKNNPDNCGRIPMSPKYRSINLATSVGIMVYEALRQRDFEGLQSQGELHRLNWDN